MRLTLAINNFCLVNAIGHVTMNLLIIDDDISILTALEMTLKNEHRVYAALTPSDIEKKLKVHDIDIIVSDFDFGPQNILQYISTIPHEIPIIIMTGKATRSDIFHLIDLNIFHFLDKPISLSQLRKKIEFITSSKDNWQKIGRELELNIDMQQRVISHNNQRIKLTPSEFKILTHFLKNSNTTINRNSLEKALWNEVNVSKNTLDTHIYNIKKKLPNLSDKIISVYGDGFLLKV